VPAVQPVPEHLRAGSNGSGQLGSCAHVHPVTVDTCLLHMVPTLCYTNNLSMRCAWPLSCASWQARPLAHPVHVAHGRDWSPENLHPLLFPA
jgi:hypothetical protein